ncbi:MAG: protein tyrosine/serine phosphatase [Planctomycetota bacterium]|nr:protein tyrosine/serine phosphatase [Planctomycetota bacterium]
MRAGIALIVIVTAVATTGYMTSETRRNQIVWDHWDEVKRDMLYRSGQLRPEQLEEAIRRYNLKTVVNFQVPGPGVEAERALCKRLNVGFLNLPMPGDGFGKEPQFREVLAAVDDPARRPVLVHCARGTCRTGAAVAMYRYERDGWTIEDVAAEMNRQTYRQAWLPGYVYAMVKDRPNGELFEPQVVRDDAMTPASQEPPR